MYMTMLYDVQASNIMTYLNGLSLVLMIFIPSCFE